jgi:hypothetical protein
VSHRSRLSRERALQERGRLGGERFGVVFMGEKPRPGDLHELDPAGELSEHPPRELAALLRSLFEYPGVLESWRQPDFTSPSEPTLTVRFEQGTRSLAFLPTMTTFKAPLNATLEDLRVESYFPLDAETERECARLAGRVI